MKIIRKVLQDKMECHDPRTEENQGGKMLEFLSSTGKIKSTNLQNILTRNTYKATKASIFCYRSVYSEQKDMFAKSKDTKYEPEKA